MGIRTELQPVLSLALGSNGVIPLDIVTAYGVFASGGIRSTPRPIISINDHYGVPIVEFPEERETALSSETAYIMTNLLSDVINRGTGGSARWKYKFYAPAAGKTGTTNNFTDAWFVGFTPHIVAGVWVGFDDPQKAWVPINPEPGRHCLSGLYSCVRLTKRKNGTGRTLRSRWVLLKLTFARIPENRQDLTVRKWSKRFSVGVMNPQEPVPCIVSLFSGHTI